MIKSGLRPTAQLRIATVLLRKTDRRDAPFALIEECVEDLDDEDCQLMKAFLVQRKFIKEMACEFNLSYDTIKRRIKYLKEFIRDDVIECMEMNCRQ